MRQEQAKVVRAPSVRLQMLAKPRQPVIKMSLMRDTEGQVQIERS